MPRSSKRQLVLDSFAEHHRSVKRARFRYRVTEFLADIPSSDPTAVSEDTESISDNLSVLSVSTNSTDSSSSSDESISFSDIESLVIKASNSQRSRLANYISTARILEPDLPVRKSGQLDLYFTYFRYESPHRFRKKLRVSPVVFDALVDVIEPHDIFHNHSNCPQLPVPIQLAVFLVRLGHYGNHASPEDIAQWAGVSLGTVENATYRCMIAVLALHDQFVMFPPEEEKAKAKEYVSELTCPEWRHGFLMGDGTKVPLFQKPGLHGEAYFDKNKDYSLDLQVCILSFFNLN